MAQLTATFYQFTKRRNSTMRPSSTGTQLNITINDGASSLLNPSIRVQYVADEPYQYNYCYINMFARYYYITDWTFNGDGTWSGFCDVDVLATWEPEIQASGGYMARCSAYQDNELLDPISPASLRNVSIYRSYPTGLTPNISEGSFVIGVISGGSTNLTNIGAVKYYLITRAELQVMLNNMISTSGEAWTDISSVGGDVLKSMVNPIQFITSCKWFPFTITNPATPEHVRLWAWDTGALARPITSPTYVQLPTADPTQLEDGWYTLILPEISESGASDAYDSTYYKWPPYPPYAQYNFITPWGTFDLDGSVMGNVYQHAGGRPTLSYKFIVSLISGMATMAVSAKYYNGSASSGSTVYDRYEFFRREVQLAYDIPISQASINYVSAAKGAISAVGSAANVAGWYTNPGGNIAGIANGLIDSVSALLSPSVQSTTTNATAFTSEIGWTRYQMRRFRTIQRAPELTGYIFKKRVTSIADPLGEGSGQMSMRGYVKMDVSNFTPTRITSSGVFVGTAEEQNAVIQYLLDGVYFE